MKANERRRFFNRSSTRAANDADLNQTVASECVASTNLYERLFVNKRLNAANAQLVKQIDEELSPYSHIYKDFTVDCLKPFFPQIEKVEKVQFADPLPHGHANASNILVEICL